MSAPRHARQTWIGKRWQRLLFALGASVLSLVTYWYHPTGLESFDQRGRDVVFNLRTAPTAPDDIAVVAVDEASIKAYGRWPWPRSTQARLLQALIDAGAAVIALDIVYAQAEHPSCDCAATQSDAAPSLTSVFRDSPIPIVGGYFLRHDYSATVDQQALAMVRASRIKQVLLGPQGRLDSIPLYPSIELNQAEIAQYLHSSGVFNRSTDSDGLVRTAPLVLRYRPSTPVETSSQNSGVGDDDPAHQDSDLLPALALQAVAVYRDQALRIRADRDGVAALQLGQQAIPVDVQGRLALNFYRTRDQDARSGIAMYSAHDVLAGTLAPEALAQRLVFVGVSEIGIADLLPTPVDPLFPGVALHATVAANIIQEQYLYRNFDTVLIDVAMTAFIPLALVIIIATRRSLWQMAATFFLFAFLLFALFYYWITQQHHLVSLIYPAAAVATAFIAFQLYYILTAQRTARFLTHAFSSYVAPALVQRLLAHPESLGLSGERRQLTLLFSDVRGFTTISEQLEPEQLVRFLNDLLGRLTEVVLRYSGTLDKYIGDAVMALFNAPLNIEQHAQKAAQAALQMQAVCTQLRSHYEQAFGIKLAIGIGLHSGEAVVGNLGSRNRFDYTAIGDSVNLAARLESITKYYGVDIIISQDTANALNHNFLIRRLDDIQVKGKSVPITIYQLLPLSVAGQRLKQAFEQALALYRQHQFEAALAAFEQLAQQYPDDGPTQLYCQRCQHFCSQPPAADWDGVFRAQEK